MKRVRRFVGAVLLAALLMFVVMVTIRTIRTPRWFDRQRAVSVVMGLPETRDFCSRIDQLSARQAHGMCMIDGRDGLDWYVFVGEDHDDHIVRWSTFIVNANTGDIRVQDPIDGTMSLESWRQTGCQRNSGTRGN